MNPEFWHGKRVFITGHTGFKGSWLSLWLKSLNAQIAGFSLSPEPTRSLFLDANVASGIQSIDGDIRNFNQLLDSLKSFQPEIVFHLAAQALVRKSYLDPIETFTTNITGTANLLEAIKTIPSVKAVVIVTTDKCYENNEWFWPYRENDRLGGNDPYSSSKACTELVTSSMRDSFFHEKTSAKIATARAGNVIGGGDYSADRLIPDLFRALESGKTLEIRYPQATRPWQHVLEPLAGYIRLAEALSTPEGSKYCEGWNFGPSEAGSASVQQIISLIQSKLPKDAQLEIKVNKAEFHEAHNLRLDISKAQAMLNWMPKLNLETTIEWTIEWYLGNMKTKNHRQLTLNQINRYQEIQANKNW